MDIKFGQKIVAKKHAVTLGGNAANVSVGLARLGVSTALTTVFGDDEAGYWQKKQLMTENVDVSLAKIDPKNESNSSAIIIFSGERTILSYHSPKTIVLDPVSNANWVYLTSSPGVNSNDVFSLLKSFNHLAFNPSVPDLKKGKDYLAPILEKTDVLILNNEEFEMLGTKGPKITVVTDGKNGVSLYDGEKQIQKPAIGENAIETTGAGDAFSSGFLSALYYGKNPEEALEWGLKNSASVILKIGAIEGLLKKDEIS